MVDLRANTYDFTSLTTRADLLGNVMASAPVREYIARRAGVDARRIEAVSPVTANVPRVLTEPGSEKRSSDILRSTDQYRLDIQANPTVPILDISSQAPTKQAAERLANSAVDGLRDYLLALGADRASTPTIRYASSSSAVRAVVSSTTASASRSRCSPSWSSSRSPAAPSSSSPVCVADGVAAARRDETGGSVDPGDGILLATSTAATASVTRPSNAIAPSRAPVGSLPPASAAPLRADVRTLRSDGLPRTPTTAGDWPRTTRVLPWMLAALHRRSCGSSPSTRSASRFRCRSTCSFDRLVLPSSPALAPVDGGGGPGSPRLGTRIHMAVGIFVAVCFLSVVVDARYLNQTLELDTAMKKLTLLISYALVFVMIASVVRRSELGAFMTYTLVLAVVCAVGIIWEYRFQVQRVLRLVGQAAAGHLPRAALRSGGRRRDRPAPDTRTRRARARGRVDAGDGDADRVRRRHARHALARPNPLRPRCLPAARRRHLDVSQDGVPGSALGDRDAGLLPSSRTAEARAARCRRPARHPRAVAGCAGSDHRAAQGNRLAAAQTVNDRTSDYDAIRPTLGATWRLDAGSEATSRRAIESSTPRSCTGSSRSASSALPPTWP